MRRHPPRTRAVVGLVGLVAGLGATGSHGQEQVVGTLHNLSASGPGEIRALGVDEVCVFCHVPHNAQPETPLWGHAPSAAHYETAPLRDSGGSRQPAPQPNGASRLCLSCHDGTVALGDLAGQPAIPFTRDRLRPGDAGFLGTDLSGGHPVSFVVRDAPVGDERSDMALRPLASILADERVRLDGLGRMQCTTCHDPHADRYYRADRVPRFWVAPTVDEVCTACHVPR